MKMLRCVIQPHKLEDLRTALEEMGILGMTIYEVKGRGQQKGHKEVYRGSEYMVSFLPKVMVEIAAPTERVQEVVDLIVKSVRTGAIGDGKIFITNLEDVVRIRTSERGSDAL